ncbi:putative vomeronasal receptor-like protein 4 [Tupaia chinensis]|uniref:putative vomeronasal receptor-like protein 4 n=1 Tax=Tupaia chinensis TaxID=246437 RepID=UPI0007041C7C|nr:putative vomeronasal receptor-like protein 4 [Tupaia chinensis]
MNIAKGAIFLLLLVLGMVGNLTVFVNYAWAFLLDAEKKAVHVILVQLTFTNIILIFTKAMSQVLVAFGVENFLHDVGCKIVIYLRRVARSLSMCSYSLLTVVQALTISPRDSVWGRHQPKAARHILPCLLLFSVFCSLVNMHVLYTITNTSKNGSREIHGNHYCRFLPQSQVTQWVIVIVMALHDVLFLGFTGVASGYMVFLLHKHHKHALYLQSTKRVYTTPPEIKQQEQVKHARPCLTEPASAEAKDENPSPWTPQWQSHSTCATPLATVLRAAGGAKEALRKQGSGFGPRRRADAVGPDR